MLQKGQEAADKGDLSLDELVQYRIQDDMLPLRFQIVSVWHHSLGALNAMESGEFAPPPQPGRTQLLRAGPAHQRRDSIT